MDFYQINPELMADLDARFEAAATPAQAKRLYNELLDTTDIKAGYVGAAMEKRIAHLRSLNNAGQSAAAGRMDRLLRVRDSSGKATPRR